MFRVLFLMLLLLAGLIAGPYLSGHQGYVRIVTENKVLEMSLVMLVVFFVIAMALLYIIEWAMTKFLRLSRGSYSWFSTRKRRKAQQQTLEGLMKMTEGDYSKAEKLIGKNVKYSDEPILNLIKAAEAAQQRGDEFSANKYLIEASNLAGNNNIGVEIARTRILLQQGKLPAARSVVDSLLELAPKNPEALRLAITIYTQSKAYAALDKLLSQIGQRSFLSEQEFTSLEHIVDDGLLDEKMNEEGQEGLLDWWENQPKRRRQSLYARVGLITRLIDIEDNDTAQTIALDTLKRADDEAIVPLLTQIARLQVEDDSKLLKLLVKREQKAQANQSDFIRALAYIYTRSGFYEKAKPYLIQLFDKNLCNTNDRMMGLYVAEHTHDENLAQIIRNKCLKEVNIKIESTPQPPLLTNNG